MCIVPLLLVAGLFVSGGALAFHTGYDRRLRERIGARLLKLWPQLQALGTIEFEHLWHGSFAVTPDKLPRLFRIDEGIVGWVGCNGRGVAFGTALGPALADAALDGEAAARRLPFEPLRLISGQALAGAVAKVAIGYYRWLDRRD